MTSAKHVRCGHICGLAVIYGLLLVSAVSAHASTNVLVQYGSRGWQTDEGLPENAVHALAQTTDGYLWVGTRRGLARFDGVRFTIFDVQNTPALHDASISALCQGRDGTLWIGTSGGGITRLREGRFLHHSLADDGRANTVKCIYECHDGTVWVGTLGGLFRYQKGVWSRYTTKDGLQDNVVRSVCESGDHLWIGTGSGLDVWRNGAITPEPGFEFNSVRIVFVDREGNLWVGSTESVACVRGGQKTIYTRQDGLPDANTTAIYEDRRGDLWVGTYGGLTRFVDGKFVVEKDGQGGFYDQINALIEDREGDIWVGARDGLHELRAKRFLSYTRQQGLTHNNVMSVLEDHTGGMWIATWGGGVVRMKDGGVTTFTRFGSRSNWIASDLVLSLFEDTDGSILAGTDYEGGTFRFAGGKFSQFGGKEQALTNRVIRVIYRDREGELWFGASPGLVKWTTREKLLEQTTVRCILEDAAGNLWVGSNDGLFKRPQGGKFERVTDDKSLGRDVISALYEDSNHDLWIGTEGKGLLRRTRDGQLRAYTTVQGLWSDEIFEILEDDHGWLWMSSPKGVFRVNKQEMAEFDPLQDRRLGSIAYGKDDGMESLQCSGVSKPAAWKGRDGCLWFATTKGVVVTDPNMGQGLNGQMPPVKIEEVWVDRKPVPLESGQTELRITPGHGEVEFHYTALSFPVPEKNRFKYRLSGVDPKWVKAGTRRAAFYNNLRPGKYAFEVLACNNDGVWDIAPAQMVITLLPHFWQTWWFLGASAAGLVGAVVVVSRYNTRRRLWRELKRLEQQHAIERERTRIARDMHDEIGAKLTKISFLGALAKRKMELPEEVEKQIDRMSQTAREMIGALDEIVWAVNPANDTLDHLATYLCRYASEFFENSPIVCQFDIPAQLPHYRLSTDVRHNVFLAVKEAMNNTLKHAGATNLRLQVSAREDVCEIVVSDNGHGFGNGKSSANGENGEHRAMRVGNGLTNMRQRLAHIGGQCTVESEAGQGTRVVFVVGLNGNGKN